MIKPEVEQYLAENGFHRVDLNRSDMSLWYVGNDSSASLIWLIKGEMISRSQYVQFTDMIKNRFYAQGMTNVNMLSVFITSNPYYAKAVGEGTSFWIVQPFMKKLMIYEDQPEDYLGIRVPLENMVFNNTETVPVQKPSVGLATPGYKPITVWVLLGINVLLFLVECIVGKDIVTDAFESGWFLVFEDGEYFRLVTAMFMHASAAHLGGNMLALYAAGTMVEEKMGHISFAVFYFISGFLADLGSCIYYSYRLRYVTSIGASGAVYGVLGGMLALLILDTKKVADAKPRLVLFAVFIIYDMISNFGATNIDNAAHVCGFVAGFILFMIINKVTEKFR